MIIHAQKFFLIVGRKYFVIIIFDLKIENIFFNAQHFPVHFPVKLILTCALFLVFLTKTVLKYCKFPPRPFHFSPSPFFLITLDHLFQSWICNFSCKCLFLNFFFIETFFLSFLFLFRWPRCLYTNEFPIPFVSFVSIPKQRMPCSTRTSKKV